MYTVTGMVIAQVFIAMPIIAGLSLAALQQLDPGFRLQILSLGAGRLRLFLLLLREIKVPLWRPSWPPSAASSRRSARSTWSAATSAARPQVLTTGIMQYVGMGEFSNAIALGVVLIILSFSTNYAMTIIQQRGRRD